MIINETAGTRREYALSGLDGSNLLGFLAALGTLKAASDMSPGANWLMRWTNETGPWRPLLAGATVAEPDDLVADLADYLSSTSNRALEIAENLNIPAETFRSLALEAQEAATTEDRRYADYIAAFGCENAVVRNRKGLPIQRTFLSATSGRQQFLNTMRETVVVAGFEHLRRSLFEPWQRDDKQLGLRWDPAEYRPYAKRWNDPSDNKDPPKTERGANRLAIEALPLLPTAIVRNGLQTTGFTQLNGNEPWISWPIWTCSINIDVVASVLRLGELQPGQQRPLPIWEHLDRLGIVAVYRSQRFIDGKYPNFTAAAPV